MATCKGLTKDGHPCKNSAVQGEEYCWIHKNQIQLQKSNIVQPSEPVQSEENSVSRHELISSSRGSRLLVWLREVITSGVAGNAVYDALKIGISKAEEAFSELKKSGNLPKAPPNEFKLLSTLTFKSSLKPILDNQLEQIRAGKIKDLHRTDLRGADLREANLRDVDLWGANLRKADLSNADLRGAVLLAADLKSANLKGANLSGAEINRAELTKADLRGACLVGAELDSANLERVDLRGAELEGASLKTANLSEANLRGAKYNKFTKWPKGFDLILAGVSLVK